MRRARGGLSGLGEGRVRVKVVETSLHVMSFEPRVLFLPFFAYKTGSKVTFSTNAMLCNKSN